MILTQPPAGGYRSTRRRWAVRLSGRKPLLAEQRVVPRHLEELPAGGAIEFDSDLCRGRSRRQQKTAREIEDLIKARLGVGGIFLNVHSWLARDGHERARES